jgi:hypothetical protein
MHDTDPTQRQRGSLNLMRYPGQSILIYPKTRAMAVSARDLFAEPIEIIVDSVGPRDDVHARIVADKQLVVVRDEIYRRNGNAFAPAPALREEAYRRAFVEIARIVLDNQQFETLSRQAWQRAMEPNQAELVD